MLFFGGGKPFAIGALPYDDGVIEAAVNPRVMIQVQIATQPIRAMVDTGAPYVVLNPELADELGLRTADLVERDVTLNIRGTNYRGSLHLIDIQLVAAEGESLTAHSTVFIPRLVPGDTWGLKPNFVGLGLLNNVRYAVDPDQNTFYFGPLT